PVHAVAAQVGRIASEHRLVVVQALAGENPTHVRPPGTFTWAVWVAFAIGFLVVHTVRGHPEDRAAFERERAAPGKEILDERIGLVAAMRQQAVIAHPDAE